MGTRSPERPFQWKVTLLGKMVFEWFENDLVRGLAKVGPINRIFSNWASVSHAKCQSLEKWSGYAVVLQGVFSHFLTQFISKTCDPLFLNKQHRIPAKLHPAFCCNPFEKDISLFVIIDHHELLCILSIITTPQINSYNLIADSDIPTVWDGGGGQAKLPRHHQVSRGQKGLSGTWASKWAEGGKVALRLTHEILAGAADLRPQHGQGSSRNGCAHWPHERSRKATWTRTLLWTYAFPWWDFENVLLIPKNTIWFRRHKGIFGREWI